MKLQGHKLSHPENETIISHLRLMQASPDFNATPQQTSLLEYVVNETLAGNADRIKGYTVATEVFGRGPDFDQSIDPVVSIQAGRLRRALEQYYLTSGKHDPIRIDIPKGTYVPTFSEQRIKDEPIGAESAEPQTCRSTWPTVLVQPLTNLTGNPNDDQLSIGLTTELTHSLCHYREIRVLEHNRRNQNTDFSNPDADFIIGGNVRRDPARITVAIGLHDARKGFQIWSGKYPGNLEAAGNISFQEQVAAEVAVRVAGGYAAIPRHLAVRSIKKAVSELTIYEAMLRYWECDTLLKPQLIVRAIQALERQVVRQPDCGLTWSMLACLYANNHALEIVDHPTPLEKAAEFVLKGVSLDPTNRRARMVLAYVRFLQNRLPEARYEVETAYRLYPDSLMVLDRIGWLTALAGEWDHGIERVKKAIKHNPYHRPWTRHVLILNWLRLGKYEMAYRETFDLTMPDLFWDQILKAAACGQLGRIEEGQTYVQILLDLKPDFARRGRGLITRFVKSEDLVDRLIEGLSRLGLNIEE